MASLLALLVAVGAAAVATRSGAMRPQDWGSGDCWNMGPGNPGGSQIEPSCIASPYAPDCFLCLYRPPGDWYVGCSERGDGSDSHCFQCTPVEGDIPQCQSCGG